MTSVSDSASTRSMDGAVGQESRGKWQTDIDGEEEDERWIREEEERAHWGELEP